MMNVFFLFVHETNILWTFFHSKTAQKSGPQWGPRLYVSRCGGIPLWQLGVRPAAMDQQEQVPEGGGGQVGAATDKTTRIGWGQAAVPK